MIDENTLYEAVGGEIRKYRQQRGWTQDQLARQVGLERTSISNIESGNQRVPLHALYLFAQAFGIDPADLLPPVREVSNAIEDVEVVIGSATLSVPSSVADLLIKKQLTS